MMVPLALRPYALRVRSLANPYHDDGGRFASEGGGADTAARRGLRPVRMPHIPVTEAATIARGADHAHAYVADVPIGLLVATQATVQPNLVHEYVKRKQERLDRTLTRADVYDVGQGHKIPPKVLAYKGRYFIADGQHRAEAAIARREPALHAIVIPVNPEWVDNPPTVEPYLERIKHLAFDPNEDRDENGQWTGGGAGGSHEDGGGARMVTIRHVPHPAGHPHGKAAPESVGTASAPSATPAPAPTAVASSTTASPATTQGAPTKLPKEAIATLRQSLPPDEAQALVKGYQASGFQGPIEDFLEQQLQFYDTLPEGDPRLQTFFSGQTITAYHALLAKTPAPPPIATPVVPPKAKAKGGGGGGGKAEKVPTKQAAAAPSPGGSHGGSATPPTSGGGTAPSTPVGAILQALAADEAKALQDGYAASGSTDTIEQFLQQQLELYLTAQEGDPRIKTFFYGPTIDAYKKIRPTSLSSHFEPSSGPIADALAAQPAWVQRVMEEYGSIRVRDVQDERPYTINGDITIASSAKPDEILGDVSHEIGHVLLYLCPAATADSAFVTAFEADQAEAKTKTKQDLGAFGYHSLRYHIDSKEEAFAELYANVIGTQTKRLDIAGGQPVKTYFPRTFAVVQAWIEKEMPLHLAFDPEQPRADDGKWAGAGDHEHQARVARALAQYKPSTHEKRVHAQASEEAVVKMIRGEPTGDNAPTDVTVKINGRVHGVEVKTFLDNTNDKITMHPESLARKVAWAARAHATLHTVLLDKRDTFGTPGYSGHRLYYHRGAGAFRLSGMTPVRDAAHLRALMRES